MPLSDAEYRSALARSREAQPVNLVFTVISIAAGWVAWRNFDVTPWIWVPMTFFGVFGFVFDSINIVFCKAQLRRSRLAPVAPDELDPPRSDA